jgi:hypothetical protein
MTMTPTQIDSLIARFGAENSAEFKRLTPQSGWLMVEDIGNYILSDAKVAFLGLVEILLRQTADERFSGGTCHKNKFGFSKKHVTRGTELALKFLSGAELELSDAEEAIKVAYSYREQLWMVRLGAVPVNNLNLRGPVPAAPQPAEVMPPRDTTTEV